ncbi:hypothetical protein TYRP_007094 [Tyrophagus putrescentiae]|nr:hypothetical protein TYRP_007094 [Tyrophagus putrescentiae]
MQDTETGTSNADISGSSRAIEVSLAQEHSTKRSASNGAIKRGGQIFGQIGQILLNERTPNLKEFLLWDDGNMIVRQVFGFHLEQI